MKSTAGGRDSMCKGPEVREGLACLWPQGSLYAWKNGNLKVNGGEVGKATSVGCHRPGHHMSVSVIKLFYVIAVVII